MTRLTRREKVLLWLLLLLLPSAMLGGAALAQSAHQCPGDIEVECEKCKDCPPAVECEPCPEPLPEVQCPGRKVRVRCVDPSPELQVDPTVIELPDSSPQYHLDVIAGLHEQGWSAGVIWNTPWSNRFKPYASYDRDWDAITQQSCSLVANGVLYSNNWYKSKGPPTMECSTIEARPQGTVGIGLTVGLWRK